MESHILNTYHQARFRTIGHQILRSTSDSSESSCVQNSPEYAPRRPEFRIQYEGNEAQYWTKCNQDWSRNETVNMTRSQESSSDEEENIDVQEISFEEKGSHNLLVSEDDVVEEHTLVEGDDYDVIQVYAVDPDLDLEASSDDEEIDDFCIKNIADDGAQLNVEKKPNPKVQDIKLLDGLIFNLDTPVVTNVDEYFIKDKDILAVKDEPIVNDVDEYFIKEDKTKAPNVDNLFIKTELPDEEPHVANTIIDVDQFFVENTVNVSEKSKPVPYTEVPIHESDLEILPNIEELKRFLLEDTSYSKFKRSCSLPQSPMHNVCLDVDDAKTCFSFGDLKLDLSDLTFDSEKDKSGGSAKSDDIPRTLTDEDVNSFLITNKLKTKEPNQNVDDLSHEDMEIDRPLDSAITPIAFPPTIITEKKCTPSPVRKSAPVPKSAPVSKSTVLDFCIEKTVKKEKGIDIKLEVEDFVDVESCNDTVIPVLEANNVNSLLEQFEATEKLNKKPKRPVIKIEEQKAKSVSLTNGMRLQDAGVQLNKTKMRQILMPTTINATVRRSPSPVHSDHDYCSPKKRFSLPNIKRGQSLLKPEVLSSNSRILNSRHRSCKSKKVIYHLSSDDESDKCDAKNKKILNNPSDVSDTKIKKPSVKETAKVIITNPTRKKLSPVHSASKGTFKDKSNNSVIVKDACKASDTPCSQNYNGSIKLTIKNKSEVILNCDEKDSQEDNKDVEKCKSSSICDKTVKIEANNNTKNKIAKNIKEVDRIKNKSVSSVDNCTNVNIKEETRPKVEHFYTGLFSNKQDVKIPQAIQIKKEKRSFEEEIGILTKPIKTEVEPHKKKKLNLQEYKLRKGGSNNSSATVSPEAIFPDMLNLFNIDKNPKYTPNLTPPNDIVNTTGQIKTEVPKKLFDPIREASRKILMNTKKQQQAEATRKRDEDIVMSKIPKVENLKLQPLISDAEMMKIVGMAPTEELPIPVMNEKPHLPPEYDEIVLVSIGVNTDETIFKDLENTFRIAAKSPSPVDMKSHINFKIKKSDHVLKKNVFDAIKRDKKSPVDEKKYSDVKIDKERYKDITATLKSVGKHVDSKMSSNSLFASIQDVVMKKAPDEIAENGSRNDKERSKSKSPRIENLKPDIKTTIFRDYDTNAEHGEDKVILHLSKERNKPESTTIVIQTDPNSEFDLLTLPVKLIEKPEKNVSRKRHDSDMSMSSEGSPIRVSKTTKNECRLTTNSKPERQEVKRSQSKEKHSRIRDRYDRHKRLRSRSRSRGRRRRRTYSRSRSRSRGRYRRYRRSDSPYRRKRRSRSPYRSSRRSPSPRREYRSNRSQSRSRNSEPTRSKTPVTKFKSPQHNGGDRKLQSLTPPPRKPTVSESSETTTSSSSSSSSSEDSRKSQRSGSSYRRDEFRKEYRNSYSSEDREINTPVEERRIVFVGKLEKDITKCNLRAQFSKFGHVLEVRLHSKDDGTRYGFVTYDRARDAWSAVEAAKTFPHYDVGFGGRRAFCRQTYADLDGLEAKYTESAFHGQVTPPARRTDNMSFEQMLLDMKQKLNQRKSDKKRPEETVA